MAQLAPITFIDLQAHRARIANALGCDGGSVITDEDGLAELILSLCSHGTGADKCDNTRIGRNARFDTGFPAAPGWTPASERLAASVLSLPMHPYLDEATQDRIIEAVLAAQR